MRADLLIVGGGWAGCSAAYQASRRGLKAVLVDAAPRLGGRASSFQDPGFGLLDTGQHLFLGAYKESLGLLEDLGTAPLVDMQKALSVPYLMADGRLETLKAAPLPGPLSLGLGLLTFAPLPAKDKAALLLLGLRSGGELSSAFLGRLSRRSADVSVAQWLKACGQGGASRSLLWEPMVLAALNARPEQARLREFLAVLGSGFLRGGATAGLGLSRVPLSELLAPLPGVLEARGCRLLPGRVAEGSESVEGPAGRRWRLRLSGGETLESPRLLLAVPARRAARLLGPAVSAGLGLDREAARPLSPIVSAWLWSARPLLPEPLQAFGPQGEAQARFHWGFSRKTGDGWRTCLVASGSPELAAQKPPAVLEAARGFLAARGRPYTWDSARVVAERAATPVFEPVSPARLSQATALEGLALAGDWTETGLPATIEGAVRSGRLAFETLTFDERIPHE